ncbi:hypothetical protein KJ596_01270 [Patescibacteria group bacterium]|nr:hypothetical protein [Patescibacteria group bacterium]MBU1868054.1 hypothetical protein [Patescibacteria group bacterium]
MRKKGARLSTLFVILMIVICLVLIILSIYLRNSDTYHPLGQTRNLQISIPTKTENEIPDFISSLYDNELPTPTVTPQASPHQNLTPTSSEQPTGITLTPSDTTPTPTAAPDQSAF